MSKRERGSARIPGLLGEDFNGRSVDFFARAPFGPGGLVAECIEPYLYSAVDSRPGPGGSRTTASCQPEARRFNGRSVDPFDLEP